MKIKGDFVLREVAGDFMLIPTGRTALKLNGMITLTEVGAVIWKAIEQGKDREEILDEIFDSFEVDRETAEADMNEFIEELKKNDFLEE